MGLHDARMAFVLINLFSSFVLLPHTCSCYVELQVRRAEMSLSKDAPPQPTVSEQANGNISVMPT
jgi:hypothetical protein